MGIAIPTFKVILDDRKQKADGTYPLKLRVTFERKRTYLSVGIHLTKEDFEKMPKSKLAHLRDIQVKIRAIETRAESIGKTVIPFSAELFQKAFLNKKDSSARPQDVYGMLSAYISVLRQEDRISTSQSYECTLNSLKKFKTRLRFEDVTPDFLNKYEQHMLEEGRSSTTVGIYLRSLRTIYNQAIEAGLVTRESYPFKKSKFQIPAGRNVKKALTKQEIQQIFNYNAVEGSVMDRAKDFWIFSYLCNGLNLKDITRLRWKDIDGDVIRVVRAKTERSRKSQQQTINIYLTEQARAVIAKWGRKGVNLTDRIFPIVPEGATPARERELIQYFTKSVNTYMKRIREDLGIAKPITSYTARHSFSPVLKRSGAPLEFISESLGHSSFKTTQAYLDSFDQESLGQYSKLLTHFE